MRSDSVRNPMPTPVAPLNYSSTSSAHERDRWREYYTVEPLRSVSWKNIYAIRFKVMSIVFVFFLCCYAANVIGNAFATDRPRLLSELNSSWLGWRMDVVPYRQESRSIEQIRHGKVRWGWNCNGCLKYKELNGKRGRERIDKMELQAKENYASIGFLDGTDSEHRLIGRGAGDRVTRKRRQMETPEQQAWKETEGAASASNPPEKPSKRPKGRKKTYHSERSRKWRQDRKEYLANNPEEMKKEREKERLRGQDRRQKERAEDLEKYKQQQRLTAAKWRQRLRENPEKEREWKQRHKERWKKNCKNQYQKLRTDNPEKYAERIRRKAERRKKTQLATARKKIGHTEKAGGKLGGEQQAGRQVGGKRLERSNSGHSGEISHDTFDQLHQLMPEGSYSGMNSVDSLSSPGGMSGVSEMSTHGSPSSPGSPQHILDKLEQLIPGE